LKISIAVLAPTLCDKSLNISSKKPLPYDTAEKAWAIRAAERSKAPAQAATYSEQVNNRRYVG